MTEVHTEAATRMVRSLTGGRWTWPPVRVVERYPSGTGVLLLRGRPVRTIHTIRRADSVEDLEYQAFLGGKVKLSSGPVHWCGEIAEVDVDYEFGSKPSMLLQRAIDRLAGELEKAESSPSECKLPDRVISINRQGVSWSLVDPNDILDKGRTGIYEIDLAIRTAGGVAKARSAVYSPEYPPPDRISFTRLPDPDAEVTP